MVHSQPRPASRLSPNLMKAIYAASFAVKLIRRIKKFEPDVKDPERLVRHFAEKHGNALDLGDYDAFDGFLGPKLLCSGETMEEIPVPEATRSGARSLRLKCDLESFPQFELENRYQGIPRSDAPYPRPAPMDLQRLDDIYLSPSYNPAPAYSLPPHAPFQQSLSLPEIQDLRTNVYPSRGLYDNQSGALSFRQIEASLLQSALHQNHEQDEGDGAMAQVMPFELVPNKQQYDEQMQAACPAYGLDNTTPSQHHVEVEQLDDPNMMADVQALQLSEPVYVCSWNSCEDANPAYTRPSELRKHMDKHNRPYKCTHKNCTALLGFTYKGGLTRHEAEVHKNAKQVYCSHKDCPRSSRGFAREDNLKDHEDRMHKDASGRRRARSDVKASKVQKGSKHGATPSQTNDLAQVLDYIKQNAASNTQNEQIQRKLADIQSMMQSMQQQQTPIRA